MGAQCICVPKQDDVDTTDSLSKLSKEVLPQIEDSLIANIKNAICDPETDIGKALASTLQARHIEKPIQAVVRGDSIHLLPKEFTSNLIVNLDNETKGFDILPKQVQLKFELMDLSILPEESQNEAVYDIQVVDVAPVTSLPISKRK